MPKLIPKLMPQIMPDYTFFIYTSSLLFLLVSKIVLADDKIEISIKAKPKQVFAAEEERTSQATSSAVISNEVIPNVAIPTEVIPTEVVVITGSRQQSRLMALANNVSLISTEDIELVTAVHPSDILNRATSVHIQATNGMESIPSIRSPILTGPGAAGAFLFLEDGIATRSAGFANNNGLSELNLAQANNVEIIRGPASATYGSNAVHGVVNALTQSPSNKNSLSLISGPNQRYQVQASAGREIENQGVRLNAQIIDDAGYRDDSDFTSIKIGFRHDYTVGDNSFKTTLSAFNLDQNTAGFIDSSDNNGECYSSTQADETLYKDSAAMKKNCDEDAYRQWTSLRIATHWQRELTHSSYFTISPYFRINQMEFRQHYLPSLAIEENSHYSFGMLSNYYWQADENLGLVLGADIESTDGELTQTQTKEDSYSFGKARQQGVHFDYTVAVSNIAPFIQLDWRPTPKLTFIGSARLDVTQYQYDNLLLDGTTKADGSYCINDNNEPIPCLYQRPSDRTDTFNNSSVKLGTNYLLNQEIALFGSWSQGFRAPQTTDLYRLQNQQVVGEIKSEKMDSIEVGIRGNNKVLSYEAVIYYMTKHNFFFRDTQGLNVTNGKTSHKGIELTLQYHFNDSLYATTNYSYGVHQYEFDNTSIGVIKGNQVDTAPEQQLNLRITWLPSTHSKFELEWLHMGDYYLDPANEHSYQGHDLLQLRASLQVNKNMGLFARIENLTDEQYATRADYAFGSYRYFGGQPRALHLGVNVDF